MPKYRLNGTVMGGKYLGEIEADSIEEAIRKGENEYMGPICLCHQCSGQCENGEVSEVHAELIEE